MSRTDSSIALLAQAVRAGDADGALEVLRAGTDDLAWIDPTVDAGGLAALRHEVVDRSAAVVQAALAGDAAEALAVVGDTKVLCATRYGEHGTGWWSEQIERATSRRIEGFAPHRRWHAGRPVIVTRNDRTHSLVNGDTGVVVDHAGRSVVAFPGPDGGTRLLSPARLAHIETWWAMTIHKSQGSEYRHAVVSLPERPASPMLTRELLYTAITRGSEQVTVVASEQVLRTAVEQRAARSSGLRARLWPTAPGP